MRAGARRATLAAVALLLTACGGGSTSGAGPTVQVGEPANGTTAVDSTSFACPDPEGGGATPAGTDTLPVGATAALICYRDNTDLWFAPPGALTEHVDRLVRLVDALPVLQAGANDACNADLGPAYSIVFRYPDGTRTISGENDGCLTVLVGAIERTGARRVFTAFLTALARQRRHSAPPDALPAAPSCPKGRLQPFSPLADPGHVVAASLCAISGSTAPVARPLTGSQVAALRHDLATARPRVFRPTPGQHLCRSPILPGPVRISALDQWGDEFVVDLACDTYTYLPLGGPGFVVVRLLPATARALTRG